MRFSRIVSEVEGYCLQTLTKIVKSASGTEFAMPAATASSESLELQISSSSSVENRRLCVWEPCLNVCGNFLRG